MYVGCYYILKSHGASIEVLALCKFDVRNAGESCYVIVQFIEVGRAQDEAKIRLSDRMAALVKSKRGIKSVLAATWVSEFLDALEFAALYAYNYLTASSFYFGESDLSLLDCGIPSKHLPVMFQLTILQVNRLILLEEDCVKAEMESAKASVDSTTLQLHSLMYEKSHYKKAVKACSDFRSNYPDIELVSEEEFFCDASEDIKVSVASNDAHSLMLKRLNFELFQVSLHFKSVFTMQ